MNMQRAVPEGQEIPDAWHHQLIFGVAPGAVFMTNPLDVGVSQITHQQAYYKELFQLVVKATFLIFI